jgi:hypothetical protein
MVWAELLSYPYWGCWENKELLFGPAQAATQLLPTALTSDSSPKTSFTGLECNETYKTIVTRPLTMKNKKSTFRPGCKIYVMVSCLQHVILKPL